MKTKFPNIIHTGERFIQEKVEDIKRDRFGAGTFLLSAFIIFTQIVFIASKGPILPVEAPLFYNRVWGAKQLGLIPQLYLLPLLSFIFLLVNFILSGTVVKGNKILIKLIQGGTVIICGLSGYTLCRIIFLIN